MREMKNGPVTHVTGPHSFERFLLVRLDEPLSGLWWAGFLHRVLTGTAMSVTSHASTFSNPPSFSPMSPAPKPKSLGRVQIWLSRECFHSLP